MIKIRYRDPNELSPGLHAAAERNGRGITVYLLSGLSAAQRRAALRRLRISARRGYGPRLPAPQLVLALVADRLRTTVGRAGAVFRSHPAGSTVPVMVISAGAIAFLALSAVSIRVIHPARDPAPSSVAGAAAPEAPVSAGTRPGQPVDAGRSSPGQPGSDQAGSGGQPSDPAATSGSKPGASGPATSGPGNGPAVNGTPAGDPNPGTSAGGAVPTPTPGGTATDPAPATSSSAPAPAASATTSPPSPKPTATKSGLCVSVGPLGVCL
jgi:hypothetical protein